VYCRGEAILAERALGCTATAKDPHGIQEYTMSCTTRDVKQQAKARQRRRLIARERPERDRLHGQQAANALEQALHDLGIPQDLVAENEGPLRCQQQLLGKICGVMFPPYSIAAPTLNCAA
jgi:hypothetical protein